MNLDRDTLFKALNGTVSPIARYKYPIGEWTEHLNPSTLWPFGVGYHLARGPKLLQHLNSTLYVAEPCPEHAPAGEDGLVVTCQARLTRVDTWNEHTARLWAEDCAVMSPFAESAIFDRLLLYLNGQPLPPVYPLYDGIVTLERSTR